jgi:hypothetical protein
MIISDKPLVFSPDNKTQGESDAARFIDQANRDQIRDLERTETLGGAAAQFADEFASTISGCRIEGWDGYGAMAVNDETISTAWRFAQVIPLGICRPSIGAEPDGHITFEWYSKPDKTLSVSVDGFGNLHYSALLGPECHYGTESFVGLVPFRILELIYQVIA